ncbi:MAG: glycoside hydrolase domain-containing protein [Paludibacteraceae bacterium]
MKRSLFLTNLHSFVGGVGAGLLLCCILSSCSEQNAAIVPERDWEHTTYLFASSDEPISNTYYRPYAGYVGDVMPVYDPVGKTFKIGYLQDFRPNPVGTYHPIWGVETTDAAHYTSLDELIPCGGINEQDAALGTGCFVYNEEQGLYYCFYTGHCYELLQAEDSREVVQMAVSSDFKTWTKSRTFLLRGRDYGYSSNDFRDPCIFRTDDGIYHMLVSTTANGKGVLAEFTSTDMTEWTHQGVFMTMMWDRFYECPDVFQMGDWWYLVYSEIHAAVRRVQYFKGRTLDELKATTKDDAGIWPDDHEGFLDSRGLYAGKTASDGQNRYLWGWCPTRSGKDNTNVGEQAPEWAGSMVAHRVVQHSDGSLSLGEVDAIRQKYDQERNTVVMRRQGEVSESDGVYTLQEGSNLLFNRLGYHNHIRLTVKTAGTTDKFAVSLCRGTSAVCEADSGVYYSLVLNPESETRRKINFEQEGEDGMGFIANIDGYTFPIPADNTYHIDIYTDNSVLVMYVNDNVCYTNRVYGIARNCWSINCYSGSLTVSDIVSYQQ